jgi:chaperonin cofactor prefoldin
MKTLAAAILLSVSFSAFASEEYGAASECSRALDEQARLSQLIRANSNAILAQLPSGEEDHLWPEIDDEAESFESEITVLRRRGDRLNQRLQEVKRVVREACPRVYPE